MQLRDHPLVIRKSGYPSWQLLLALAHQICPVAVPAIVKAISVARAV